MERVHLDYGNVRKHSPEDVMRIQSESCLCTFTASGFQVLALFWSKNRSILFLGYSPSLGFVFVWMTFRGDTEHVYRPQTKARSWMCCDSQQICTHVPVCCLKQSTPHLSTSFSFSANLSYSPAFSQHITFLLEETTLYPRILRGWSEHPL